jgi:hypothetical protein
LESGDAAAHTNKIIFLLTAIQVTQREERVSSVLAALGFMNHRERINFIKPFLNPLGELVNCFKIAVGGQQQNVYQEKYAKHG